MPPDRAPQRLRLGVLGAGRIARKSIEPAARVARNVVLVAAASRDRQRAESLGAQRVYDSYAALLEDPGVDAVFITTHNGLHCALAVEALQRGKHVLCEKPLAITVAECERIVAEAERAGRRVMEAFMYRYHPQIAALQDVVRSGRIGEVRRVSASFHFQLSRLDDVRLVREFGGGALLDVGCYCVNASRLFLGEDVTDVTASAVMSAPDGVDMEGRATLSFANGAKADISFGFAGPLRQRLALSGPKGEASLNWAFAYRGEPHVLEVRRGDSVERVEFGAVDTYRLEIEDFAGAIIAGRRPMLAADEGVKNAVVLDRIAQAFGRD